MTAPEFIEWYTETAANIAYQESLDVDSLNSALLDHLLGLEALKNVEVRRGYPIGTKITYGSGKTSAQSFVMQGGILIRASSPHEWMNSEEAYEHILALARVALAEKIARMETENV